MLFTGHDPITTIVIFHNFNTYESVATNNISFRKNKITKQIEFIVVPIKCQQLLGTTVNYVQEH